MKFKVLQVLEAVVGGTRRHLLSLVAGLDKSRFEVEVAAPAVREGAIADRGFAAEMADLGVRWHVVPMVRAIRPLADMRALAQLTWLIRGGGYDLVHVHSSKAGFLGRLAAKVNGRPTVYTPNGFYFLDEANGRRKKALFLQLERWAGPFTDKLIAVSPSEQAEAIAQRLVPAEKVVLIPNGIPLSQFQPDPEARGRIRAELGLEEATAVVGTISRYIPQKDPFTLVRAMRLVHEQAPQTRFVWCGEGDMRAETEQLAHRLGVHEVIHFLGFRPDIQAVLNSFDLFVLSSVFEGLPYTLLEAMALQLPVVATDVVGNRDVIQPGETGWLVPPGQPEALAAALGQLLANPAERAAFGLAGRVLVNQQYGVTKMVTAVETLYTEIISADKQAKSQIAL